MADLLLVLGGLLLALALDPAAHERVRGWRARRLAASKVSPRSIRPPRSATAVIGPRSPPRGSSGVPPKGLASGQSSKALWANVAAAESAAAGPLLPPPGTWWTRADDERSPPPPPAPRRIRD